MGTIFKFHPATGVLTTVDEMPLPPFLQYGWGGLRFALVNDGMGYWWGTTPGVGLADCGTVFKVNAATGELVILLEFTEGKGGTHPDAGLVSDGQGHTVQGSTKRNAVNQARSSRSSIWCEMRASNDSMVLQKR